MLTQGLPTDGTLMAMLALAGIPYDRRFRFAMPLRAVRVRHRRNSVAVAIGLE